MKWCWVCTLLLCYLCSRSQSISTFAGCGTMCTALGEGGPATNAQLIDPSGGVYDKYGNFYFVEPTGHRVRKITTGGIINTVAGTGYGGYAGDSMPATTALLNEPVAVIIDTFGNLYIDDLANGRIRKIEAISGIINTICGNGINGFYGDGGRADTAKIAGVQDICFDKFNNLYLADAFNYRVRKINNSGIISTFAGSGGFSATGTGDGTQATLATFNTIVGLACDKDGNIYIADYTGAKVRKVNTFGIISTIAGNGSITYIGDGIQATNAQLVPSCLTFDEAGNLIIGDRINERVYKIDSEGILHCIAGNGLNSYSGDGGPATLASFDVGRVAYDKCWNLYIPDINNRRIRKITFDSSCNLHTININEIEVDNSLNIYPNPATTTLTLQTSTQTETFTIINYLGQNMLTKRIYGEETIEIDIGFLPNGIYLVKATGSNGVQVKSFLKE